MRASGNLPCSQAGKIHWWDSNTGLTSPLSTWEGNEEEGKIILYRDSSTPNGTPRDYRLTFSDSSKNSYNWVGEWVDKAETIVYPTWKISCKRKK